MIELRGYIDENGNKPFAKWLDELDITAAAKVTIALARMEQGNFSKAKGVGAGVYEYKIDFGPGYRIYFGKDGDYLVILVGGGTKKRQPNDIKSAHKCWPITSEERNRRSHKCPLPMTSKKRSGRGRNASRTSVKPFYARLSNVSSTATFPLAKRFFATTSTPPSVFRT
jgi:putative addiction module killer protein